MTNPVTPKSNSVVHADALDESVKPPVGQVQSVKPPVGNLSSVKPPQVESDLSVKPPVGQ
jgi:hypothetical protein